MLVLSTHALGAGGVGVDGAGGAEEQTGWGAGWHLKLLTSLLTLSSSSSKELPVWFCEVLNALCSG